MSCGAVLYFDQETDADIRGLWQVIEDAGLPSRMLNLTYPPHLTFLICEEMHLDQMRSELVRYIAQHPPLVLEFSGFGIFPGEEGVVYLAPTVNRALLDLHAEFWKMVGPFIQPENAYYSPETWVPHVTLDYNLTPAETGAVISALSRANWPRKGILREMVIASFGISEDGVGASSFNETFKARLGSFL